MDTTELLQGLDPKLLKLVNDYNPQPEQLPILPEKGFVIKTKTVTETDYPKNTKVFINICYSDEIPAPPLLSKQEIITAINGSDPSAYKVPLSMSQLRSDVDKSGNICIVCDACINSVPFNQAIQDGQFKLFIMELAVEWAEEKYALLLSRELVLPKMQSKGKLVPHYIKRQKRPVIKEVKSLKPQIVEPSYIIVCEPEDCPKYMAIQINLPVDSMEGSILDIEAKRLIFSLNEYKLDIALPHAVDIDQAGAQFDHKSKYLHVTCSVV